MPHTQSATKRLRKAKKRRVVNRAAAKQLNARRKAMDQAITGQDAAMIEAEFRLTQSTLDRKAAKGYIHPNKAARLKSRIIKKLRSASGQMPTRTAVPPPIGGTVRPSPTRRRPMDTLMAKFKKHTFSQPQLDALAREDAALDANFPGEYVAYLDTWAGVTLTRRVVAHARTAVAFQQLLAAVEPAVREKATLSQIPVPGSLFVPSVQLV